MKNTDKTAAKPSDNKEKKTAAPENNRIRQMKKAVRYQIFLAAGTLLVVLVLVFAMTSAWYTNVAKTSSLSFTVERSAKTLVGSGLSGEGLVNVYRGTGKILMAPVG